MFDTGVKKALEQSLDQEVLPRTSIYGELFESFVINKIVRLNSYFEKDFRFSYFATKNNFEIDLVMTKGRVHYLIEIKSKSTVDVVEAKSMNQATADFPNVKRAFYLSNDERHQKIGRVECIHWTKFLALFKLL